LRIEEEKKKKKERTVKRVKDEQDAMYLVISKKEETEGRIFGCVL